jgi:predicted DNA-binding transcriptional regulator YafY
MQVLRGRQRPSAAHQLAQRLSVSVRTVYRDVQSLVELGASIEGSAGVGYVLRSGFFLPPLMFSDDEIESLAQEVPSGGSRDDVDLPGPALSTSMPHHWLKAAVSLIARIWASGAVAGFMAVPRSDAQR